MMEQDELNQIIDALYQLDTSLYQKKRLFREISGFLLSVNSDLEIVFLKSPGERWRVEIQDGSGIAIQTEEIGRDNRLSEIYQRVVAHYSYTEMILRHLE